MVYLKSKEICYAENEDLSLLGEEGRLWQILMYANTENLLLSMKKP